MQREAGRGELGGELLEQEVQERGHAWFPAEPCAGDKGLIKLTSKFTRNRFLFWVYGLH